ncbi:glycosyl hydrolase family 17 protein [Myxococcota bacterium]|nr:glycosyl hydrolase family 17 protein [Myxococcota bacterium]
MNSLSRRSAPLLALVLISCARPGPLPPAAAPASAIAQAPEALIAGTHLAIAYSGYREGQHPDQGQGAVYPSAEQIREDLDLLQRDGFGLIRLYDAGELSRRVLDVIVADGRPVRVLLGAWLQAEVSNHEGCAWLTEPIPEAELAANTLANREEVARLITLAQAYPDTIVAVNVGNEALVSWGDHMVRTEAMVEYLRQVRDAVDQPVSTADNYVVWAEQGQVLAPVVDFLMVHTYPQWEEKTLEEAMPYTLDNLGRVHAAVPTLPIVIGEAGWATVASEFGDRANEEAQRRYVSDLMAWAAQAKVTTFIFEAFDEPWKGDPADPLGAEKHWGLYTVDRQPKLLMRAPPPSLGGPLGSSEPPALTPR